MRDMLHTFIAFLGPDMNYSASCEALRSIIDARREANWMIEEGWKHSYLKYLDVVYAASWDPRDEAGTIMS